MSSSSPTSLSAAARARDHAGSGEVSPKPLRGEGGLDVDVQPGKPPMLRVDATGDAPRWAADHRDALGAAVVEHGSLLIRGLGLRDAAETEAAFRQLGSLMSETEAFAPRRSHAQ